MGWATRLIHSVLKEVTDDVLVFLLQVWVFDLVHCPVARSILPDVLADSLVFLDEDLVLPRGLFVVAPDNELLTCWWLRTKQSCLCDLLQTHSNR